MVYLAKFYEFINFEYEIMKTIIYFLFTYNIIKICKLGPARPDPLANWAGLIYANQNLGLARPFPAPGRDGA